MANSPNFENEDPNDKYYTANKSCQLQPDYSQMAVILLELQSMAVHSQ